MFASGIELWIILIMRHLFFLYSPPRLCYPFVTGGLLLDVRIRLLALAATSVLPIGDRANRQLTQHAVRRGLRRPDVSWA
mgnify:CR=1 FL=1